MQPHEYDDSKGRQFVFDLEQRIITSAVNRSVIWSICVRIICGSSLAISIMNVAMVFAEALSACAATKFVSQISLNEK